MIAVLFMSMSFAACSDDDKDEPGNGSSLNKRLVGTWIETNLEEDDSPYTLVLRSNQTGMLSYTVDSNSSKSRVSITVTQNFSWNAGTNASGFSYVEILTTGGDNILDDDTYTLSLIGDDLSFGGLRFKRQK